MKTLLPVFLFAASGLSVLAQEAFQPHPLQYARNHTSLSWYQGMEIGNAISPVSGNHHPRNISGKVFYGQLAHLVNFNERFGIRGTFEAGEHQITILLEGDREPFFLNFNTMRMTHLGAATELVYRKPLSGRVVLYGGGGPGIRWTGGGGWGGGIVGGLNHRIKHNFDPTLSVQSFVGANLLTARNHMLTLELKGRLGLGEMYWGNYTNVQPQGQPYSEGDIFSRGHTLVLGLGYQFSGTRLLMQPSVDPQKYNESTRKELRQANRNSRDWGPPDRGLYFSSTFGLGAPGVSLDDPNGVVRRSNTLKAGGSIEASLLFELDDKWHFYLSAGLAYAIWGFGINVPEGATPVPENYFTHFIDFSLIEAGAGRRIKLDDGRYLADLRLGVGVAILESSFESYENSSIVRTGTNETLELYMEGRLNHEFAPVAHIALSRDWRLYPHLSLVTAIYGRYGLATLSQMRIDYEIIGNEAVPPTMATVNFAGSQIGFNLGLKYRIAGWNRHTQ